MILSDKKNYNSKREDLEEEGNANRIIVDPGKDETLMESLHSWCALNRSIAQSHTLNEMLLQLIQMTVIPKKM